MGLAFTGMLLWQAWQEDYGPAPQVSAEQRAPVADDTPDAPEAAVPQASGLPAIPEGELADARYVDVQTDTFKLKIDTRGGSIVEAYLQEYPVSLKQPENKFRLLSSQPASYYVVQSGLLSRDAERAPTHQAVAW